MTIHEVIRSYRERVGISQRELARRSRIPCRSICDWEAGKGNPTIERCIRIARGLGITIGELIADVSLPEDEAVEER